MTLLLLLYLANFSWLTYPEANDPQCKVLVEQISGSYDGDCKKGLAEGSGTARGTDVYTGEFKKGYPDGMGRYIWKNGNYYSGDFEKGKRQGYGELVIKRNGEKDSLVAGYWTKDVYIGVSSVAWKVRSSTNIKNVSFEKKTDNGTEIYIVFQQDKKPVVADGIRLTNDQGIKPASEFDTSVLRKVEYPFMGANLQFRSQGASGVLVRECELAFDIFEKGRWIVTVEIE